MFSLENEINHIFNSLGQQILVNETSINAIVTNPAISEYEERYIHTLSIVPRGAVIDVEGIKYLAITESVSERGKKYKVLARHCNYVIEIEGEVTQVPRLDENGNPMYDDFGQPLFTTVYGDPIYVPSIVDNKTFSIDNSSSIRVPANQIEVIVSDTTQSTSKLKANFNFMLMDKNWKVVNQDKSKKGLLILTCELI